MENNVNEKIEKEVYCGILPVLKKEQKYGFIDALLVLSGYCIATWSYTQGSYLATLVGFKQLLIGAFAGALLMLLIYQLPVIMSVRYGIDIWIWLRSVFGTTGVKIMTVVIIVINFPWYAVCCDLFADSMMNLFAIFNIILPSFMHLVFSLLCVLIGTIIAYKGVSTITWTTRILVPLLLAVGVIVVIVGFKSVPAEVIWNYKPIDTGFEDNHIAYILSIEANFAFVITLVGGMAEIPRLCKKEKSGFYAGVLGQGLAGSFFVVVGAVMAIAMQYVTGKMIDDPTMMMATLASPVLGLSSLLLVAFANIGTQAVGSYIYSVMLKSTFRKANYRLLVIILGIYVGGLCIWGKITEYFGAFLTISALIYAPLAALLFVDFFFVRKQKMDIRSAYEIEGHNAYYYSKGFNIVGFICLVFGVVISLLTYNPVTCTIHNKFLFYFTPTGLSFVVTAILYACLYLIPPVRRYLRHDTWYSFDSTAFDRKKVPPKQSLLLMPIIWLYCFWETRKGKLKITKTSSRGIKPPFIVLGTHHSFTDFYVTPLALFPYRANYISELEGFEWFGEGIYRKVGCLGTRKFVDDLWLIKNIKRVLDRKGILVLYPEARYANVGTFSGIPKSVSKMIKSFKVPVVVLNMQGNYLQSPIWNLRIRKEAKLNTLMTYALTKEDVENMSVDDIHSKLSELLEYDEYKYQRENGIHITDKFRAEGLEKPLYQCIDCFKEFEMETKGSTLYCKACKAKYEMDTLGNLVGKDKTITIPEWYEWERNNVINEINNEEYCLDMKVRVEALPNSKNFIPCEDGHLRHDKNGFYLAFKHYLTRQRVEYKWSPEKMLSVHTEYDYRGQGQCITLSTVNDTFFIYPLEPGFNSTKIEFATEFLFGRNTKKEKL